MPSERIILHLDLDYFFAQVEELRHPDSVGKPIVVCIYSGRTADSGAVSTCNYVARKYGVRAGMPIVLAKKKLQGTDALFLRANHELYAQVSARIMQVIMKYADKFEQASIDEAFVDISEKCQSGYERAKLVAEKIKEEIFVKERLTCSVGIGPNRLIAKIASGVNKPNGMKIVKPGEVMAFLGYMGVDAIPGIGKKTKEFLERMSIRTVADLRAADPTVLAEKFGKKTGGWLFQASRGIDETEVAMAEEQKQISRISTLKRNSRDIKEILPFLEEMIREIKSEISRFSLSFETVGIIAIDENMQTHSRSKTLAHASSDEGEIRKIAAELFLELIESTEIEFRRVGVKVERLANNAGQKTLGEF